MRQKKTAVLQKPLGKSGLEKTWKRVEEIKVGKSKRKVVEAGDGTIQLAGFKGKNLFSAWEGRYGGS